MNNKLFKAINDLISDLNFDLPRKKQIISRSLFYALHNRITLSGHLLFDREMQESTTKGKKCLI